MVAIASVSRMSRVRYSSPATMADSVLSMPPTTVASAKGTASGRYGSVASRASSQASVGSGRARPRAPSVIAGCGPGVPAAAARAQRPQKTRVPASTAASAPGRPHGIRTPPISAARSTISETTPTRGSPKMRSEGRKAMSRIATPAIEPSSAARGTTRRAQSPAKAQPSLITPIATVTPMPIFQAITGSRVRSIAGPRTPKTIPKRDGVSRPKGIAVTSLRPVRRISRTASPV